MSLTGEKIVTGSLYFGRDVLGRRSLLVGIDQGGAFHISSVNLHQGRTAPSHADAIDLQEIDCGSLWRLDLSSSPGDAPKWKSRVQSVSRSNSPCRLVSFANPCCAP